MKPVYLLCFTGALALMACGDKSIDSVGTSSTPATASSTSSTTTSAVPTPEDYEAQASTEITADNLDTKLDSLEKEIGK